MALSEKQVKNMCLGGTGFTQCRYMVNDKKDYKKCYCVKLLAARKKKIDVEVDAHLKTCKKNGTDPKMMWSPCGTGGACAGYAYLPTVHQGYDVKP